MPERRDWRRHEALFRDAFELTADVSPSELFRRVVAVAVEVADAASGFLVALDADGEIHDLVTFGIQEERRRIDRATADRGVLGRVLATAGAQRADSSEDDPSLVAFPRTGPTGPVLALPISLWGRVFGAVCVARTPGAPRFDHDDEVEMASLGAQAGVALDHARLRQESRARQQALLAVDEVSRAILEARNTDDVLQLIAARARALACSAIATVSTPDPSGETLVHRAADGDRARELLGRSFPTTGSISADVMRTRRPLVIEDVSSDPRVAQPMVQLGGFGPALFVPLAVGKRVFGTLAVTNEIGGRRFTEDDLLLLQTFATEAAVALEYGQVRSEVARLSLLEERERIAMDLHDGVIQALFVVGLTLQGAESAIDDAAEMRVRLEDAIASIDRAIRDLREYIFGLRPLEEEAQLERALRDVAVIFERAGNLSISVGVDPAAAARLEPVAAEIIQIAREAMSNALRHSGGAHLDLRLTSTPGDGVMLEISDDGTGFDPGQAKGRGNGLANLATRAEAVGGSLDLDAAPGRGSTVRIVLPT